MKYQPQTFEKKWADQWASDKLYQTPHLIKDSKKRYILDMFPYPSGAGLHVGHIEGYTATDIFSRYSRMKGYQVLHPMGFDSFGLPAENYAIKTGVHPAISTEEAIKTFTAQMQSTGLSYDWDLVLAAHRPEYYRWTQWFFLFLYKRGLAYRKKQAVNWCPGLCQTVLANEQVVDGKCERCDTPVIQKDMEQWFFKITDYAERLLQDLDRLDWPESTKAGQRNWIGKREGIEITYAIKEEPKSLVTVFTTRPETNFGSTFVVVAPDGEFVKKHLNSFPEKAKVAVYVEETKQKKELERLSEGRKKTGVFTGWHAINMLTGKDLPIYVADFALGTVGTGCLVGVPGHDLRDFDFAKAMGLPIVRVVSTDGDTSSITERAQVQEDEGTMVNSNFLDGMDIHTATAKMMDYLEEKGWGKRVINYKIRDWLISRQRFWGAPIPMRKSKEDNGEYEYTPVDESELPVVLPMDVEFKPTGKSPLTEHPAFAGREVDTMDTFVCSSWYFLRFAMLTNEKVRAASQAGKETNPFDNQELKTLMNSWMPVDLYVGGAEHTVLHLLYSRFFTKVLFDAGLVNFDEPFQKLRHQGTILGPDSRKMSKRWGNVINPVDVINQYGADTLRMYEMFMGPIDQMKAWQVESVAGVYRFLARVWHLSEAALEVKTPTTHKDILVSLHKTIKKVDSDIAELKFNTAIAIMMEHINIWEKIGAGQISVGDLEKFLTLLAPFAPFITEELYTRIHPKKSIHLSAYPTYDPDLLQSDTTEIPVQVNGKVRDTLVVPTSEALDQAKVVSYALASEKIKKFIIGQPKKIIFVPGRILNLIA